MNRWSIIRENVVAALATLSFPRDVVVAKLARPAGIDGIVGPVVIGVSLGGDRWIGPSEIDNHINQPAAMIVQITIKADSAIDTTDALDASGAIEDISAIALQVRNVDIGIYGMGDDLDTGGVFLDGLRSDFLEFTGREPGGAGPLAKVFTLQTTALPI